MMSGLILVADDDKKTVDLVQTYLRREGYRTLAAYDGNEALTLVREQRPALIVLDVMLPGVDGLAVCRTLREEGDQTPVIMLTARSLEEDKTTGLDLGADDYVTKPFSLRELVSRVRAVLRRASDNAMAGPAAPAVLHSGDLVLDIQRHEVTVGGRPATLTPREFSLLRVLMEQPGRAFTRRQLLDLAFGYDYDGLERTADAHIMNLRRKIEPDPARPKYVLTVPGVGYKFAEAAHVA